MEVDPRLLLYLKAVNDHGTLTSAAHATGISQPALTNKIKLLERQLGTDLVDRGRHGAKLNHFGKLVLRHAKMIGASLNSATEGVTASKIWKTWSTCNRSDTHEHRRAGTESSKSLGYTRKTGTNFTN